MDFSVVTPEFKALIVAEMQKRTAAARSKPYSGHSKKAKEVYDLIHDAEFGNRTDVICRLFEVVLGEPIPKVVDTWPPNVAIIWEGKTNFNFNKGELYLPQCRKPSNEAHLATDEEIASLIDNVSDVRLLEWAERLMKVSSSR